MCICFNVLLFPLVRFNEKFQIWIREGKGSLGFAEGARFSGERVQQEPP